MGEAAVERPDDDAQLRCVQPEMLTSAAHGFQAAAGRMRRYQTQLDGEILPLIESGAPEARADAAGRTSCLSQEIAAEIDRLRAIHADVHRAQPGSLVTEALQGLLSVHDAELTRLATALQGASTRLFHA